MNDQIQYLRGRAQEMRHAILDVPGGPDGVAALVIRQAATFILNAASLAEEYEANRMIKEEKSNVEA